jgi:hypothetical protein
MDWRSFRLLNDRELRLTGDVVRRALSSWSADWMNAGELDEVRCVVACERPKAAMCRESDPWLGAGGADGVQAWICVTESLRATLERQLFGEQAGRGVKKSNLIPTVLEAALRSLLELLVAASGEQKPPERPVSSDAHPPAQVWERGSGAIACVARFAELTLEVVLAEAWGRKLFPTVSPARRRLPAPVDRRMCLESCRARLTVWAGSAAIELGQLQTLATGDVVKLDLRIDTPMRVDVDARDSGRRVFLGFAGDRKAIQFGPPQ